jgi:hypothetical protein
MFVEVYTHAVEQKWAREGTRLRAWNLHADTVTSPFLRNACSDITEHQI